VADKMAAMADNGTSHFSNRLRGPGKAPFRGKLVRVKLKGKPLLEICSHALERMKERGISVDEVIHAIRKPTRTGLPTPPPRRRVRKHRTRSEAVDVVYEVETDRIIVVTAILIKGIRPSR
jgi:hypothetical protein